MEPVTRQKTRRRRWAARKITAALAAVGVTHEALALRLGCSRSNVSMAVSGATKSWKVASAIAALLGLHPHDIWPRLYAAPSGEPAEAAIPNRRNAIRRDRRMERRHAQEGPNGPPLQPIGPDESIPHAS